MPLTGDFVTRYQCPYCEVDTPTQEVYTRSDNLGSFFHLVKCMNVNCKKETIFVYEGASVPMSVTDIPVKLIHQFPTKEGTTHESIPDDIAESYKQGVRCLNANAPIGAVTCFRRSLQQICKNKNTTKKDLNDQIDEVIPVPLKDIAHEIRLWGNFGAHPDDFIKNVTKDDAEEIKDFIDSIFETVYITPHRVQERKNKRKKT